MRWKVRLIVHSIDLGVRRVETLSDFTGYSIRHTGYRLHAARIIGLVSMDGDEAHVTALGERLLCTDPHSEAERAVFYDAIQGSAVIQLLVPELLSLVPPSTDTTRRAFFAQSKLGRAQRHSEGRAVRCLGDATSLAMLRPLSGHVERAGNLSP